MTCLEFVTKTVCTFSDETLKEIMSVLVGEYLKYSIIQDNQITKEIFAEKLCDYFEKLQLKTGRNFDKEIESYMSDFNKIVEDGIVDTPHVKKGETPKPTPRARLYYDKANDKRKSPNLTVKILLDYSRVMMCLYTAIIESNNKNIENFDYSISCLNIEKILSAMKKENRGIVKAERFDTKELYCSDTCTFIITIVMFYVLKDTEVKGEY